MVLPLVLPPLPPIAGGAPQKEILRLRMGAERDGLAKKRPDAGRHAARIFLDNISLPEGAVISLFHSIRNEIDTWPLAEALIERGFQIALPVTPKKKGPLIFRVFREGDELVKDKFGVMTPTEEAREITPSIIVAPLLAFTREGARLGYGGGYYDRTLEKLRAEGDVLAVGFAYAGQEVDKLPVTKCDQKLDWIITEREAIDARGTPWG